MRARPETVDAMRAACNTHGLNPDDHGADLVKCLTRSAAAAVADRLVADAVQAERRRIASELRDLALELDYSAAGLVEEIAVRLDPAGANDE